MKCSLQTVVCAAALATIPILFAQQAPMPTPGSIAIQHVTIIDVEPGGRSADQTVVVTGNRIATVGGSAEVKTPSGARILDGRGQFLIPGPWDAHVHAVHIAFEGTLPFAIARGVTDARDMGAPIPYLLRARKAIGGGLLSPRLFVAGPPLDGVSTPNGIFPPEDETVLKTPEEARQMVDQLAGLKVNFIQGA